MGKVVGDGFQIHASAARVDFVFVFDGPRFEDAVFASPELCAVDLLFAFEHEDSVFQQGQPVGERFVCIDGFAQEREALFLVSKI